MQKANLPLTSSVFGRLIMIFFTVMLPVYLMGFWVFSKGVSIITDGTMKSVQAQSDYCLSNLEADIKRMQRVQFEFALDNDLAKLTGSIDNLDSLEITMAINRLYQKLSLIRSNSEYIKAVRLYVPSITRTIEAGPSSSVIPLDQGRFNNLVNQVGSRILSMVFIGNIPCLTLVYSSTPFTQQAPSFVMEVELDPAKMNSMLKKQMAYSNSASIIADIQNGVIFASAGETDFQNEMVDLVKGLVKSKKAGMGNRKMGKEQYIYVYSYVEEVHLALITYIPKNIVLTSLGSFRAWFLIYILLSFLIIIPYSVYNYRLVRKPLSNLIKAFGKLEEGKFDISLEYKYNNEFRYLFSRFNLMVSNLQRLVDQVYQQTILVQEAELKQLQAQINPHFLYNSFFILSRMAKLEDYDNLITFLDHLGNYFRYVTRNTQNDEYLELELSHALTYLGIQQVRFSNRISVDVGKLPERYKKLKVPRLILQPLIENSFKHGLENMHEGGMLRLRFEDVESALIIIVEDNAGSMPRDKLDNLNSIMARNSYDGQEITGLLNINRRLRLRFGPRSGIYLSTSELGGLKVEMTICQDTGGIKDA